MKFPPELLVEVDRATYINFTDIIRKFFVYVGRVDNKVWLLPVKYGVYYKQARLFFVNYH